MKAQKKCTEDYYLQEFDSGCIGYAPKNSVSLRGMTAEEILAEIKYMTTLFYDGRGIQYLAIVHHDTYQSDENPSLDPIVLAHIHGITHDEIYCSGDLITNLEEFDEEDLANIECKTIEEARDIGYTDNPDDIAQGIWDNFLAGEAKELVDTALSK